MTKDPMLLVVMIACLIVAGILMVGIAGFGKGGDFNKKYANKIMRWRVGAQFVAVLLILAMVAMRQTG